MFFARDRVRSIRLAIERRRKKKDTAGSGDADIAACGIASCSAVDIALNSKLIKKNKILLKLKSKRVNFVREKETKKS